jgi:hypothetical protein
MWGLGTSYPEHAGNICESSELSDPDDLLPQLVAPAARPPRCPVSRYASCLRASRQGMMEVVGWRAGAPHTRCWTASC